MLEFWFTRMNVRRAYEPVAYPQLSTARSSWIASEIHIFVQMLWHGAWWGDITPWKSSRGWNLELLITTQDLVKTTHATLMYQCYRWYFDPSNGFICRGSRTEYPFFRYNDKCFRCVLNWSPTSQVRSIRGIAPRTWHPVALFRIFTGVSHQKVWDENSGMSCRE